MIQKYMRYGILALSLLMLTANFSLADSTDLLTVWRMSGLSNCRRATASSIPTTARTGPRNTVTLTTARPSTSSLKNMIPTESSPWSGTTWGTKTSISRAISTRNYSACTSARKGCITTWTTCPTFQIRQVVKTMPRPAACLRCEITPITIPVRIMAGASPSTRSSCGARFPIIRPISTSPTGAWRKKAICSCVSSMKNCCRQLSHAERHSQDRPGHRRDYGRN